MMTLLHIKRKRNYLQDDLIAARELQPGDEMDYPRGAPSSIKRYAIYNRA